MNGEQLAERYSEQFGEYPPMIFCISYDDEHYKELMIKSLIRGTKITEEELDQMAEAEPYDIA